MQIGVFSFSGKAEDLLASINIANWIEFLNNDEDAREYFNSGIQDYIKNKGGN